MVAVIRFEQFLLGLVVEAPNIVAVFAPTWAAVRRVLGIERAERWQTLEDKPFNEKDLPQLFAELSTASASPDRPLSIDAKLGRSAFNDIYVHGAPVPVPVPVSDALLGQKRYCIR
jgi:hypothetical protein